MSIFDNNVTTLTIGEKVYQYALEEQNRVHDNFRGWNSIPNWVWRSKEDVMMAVHNSSCFIAKSSVTGHFINKAVKRLSEEMNIELHWRFINVTEHDIVKHYKTLSRWKIEIKNDKYECISVC